MIGDTSWRFASQEEQGCRSSCAVVRFYVAKYMTAGAELRTRTHGATDTKSKTHGIVSETRRIKRRGRTTELHKNDQSASQTNPNVRRDPSVGDAELRFRSSRSGGNEYARWQRKSRP